MNSNTSFYNSFKMYPFLQKSVCFSNYLSRVTMGSITWTLGKQQTLLDIQSQKAFVKIGGPARLGMLKKVLQNLPALSLQFEFQSFISKHRCIFSITAVEKHSTTLYLAEWREWNFLGLWMCRENFHRRLSRNYRRGFHFSTANSLAKLRF